MKNFVLALLLALGVSNVSAKTPEIVSDIADATHNAAVTVSDAATKTSTAVSDAVTGADLDAIIAQEDAETKAGLLNWIKANPIKFTAAVAAVAALGTYGYFACKAYDKDTGYKAAAQAPFNASYTFCDKHARCAAGHVKDGFDKSVTYAQNNKPMVIGGAVAAAALVLVLIDLAQKDGYIRTACSKTADTATVVANDVATEVAIAANNVAEAVTNDVAS